jgi:polysaccharide biosynthesis/export protein
MHSHLSIPLVFGFSLYLSGCTSTVLAPALQDHTPTQVNEELGQNATGGDRTGQNTTGVNDQDRKGREEIAMARFTQLWSQRTQAVKSADYPIGPGDVLDISVPNMDELANRTVRVSGEGTISLPFIGVMQVTGLTEKGIKEEIQHRLAEKYMKDPQVNLFVHEYRSRQVAVIGAVNKPGLYSLASGSDTILDMIALAGGMTNEAAERIQFFPAEPLAPGQSASQLASLKLDSAGDINSALHSGQKADLVIIDLRTAATKGGNEAYLALPARPGDVIMVPISGQVVVAGWVGKPGTYQITPGLTVLGAVVAAGGPLFPANTSAVRVVSTGKDGETTFVVADLEKITRGESRNIPVQEGDVIEVSSSAAKMIPYGAYSLITTIFRFGLNTAAPVF